VTVFDNFYFDSTLCSIRNKVYNNMINMNFNMINMNFNMII